jgi:VIT1/CCC1 family predicted Fe2+/Mn2+ transporter
MAEHTRTQSPHPHEIHKSQRSGWLRAAVLGVNDGIVSTSSLMIGVSTASTTKTAVLTAGIAGLAAGAFSMAVGEYVSVSSQRDAEMADIAIEERSIAANPKEELHELAQIYEARGLDSALALTVAKKLHSNDAVAAHARDELGFDDKLRARPIQASVTSAMAFSIGALVPVLATILTSGRATEWAIVISSLVALALSGAVGAHIGGGRKGRAAARVLIGSGLAMAATALIGHFIGATV